MSAMTDALRLVADHIDAGLPFLSVYVETRPDRVLLHLNGESDWLRWLEVLGGPDAHYASVWVPVPGQSRMQRRWTAPNGRLVVFTLVDPAPALAGYPNDNAHDPRD